MDTLENLLSNDNERMEVLAAVESLNLNEAYIAAGFLRNLYWDSIHNKSTQLNDVDVIFFDDSDTDLTQEREAENTLKAKYPNYEWQVKNQAFMHIKNGDAPYQNILDAMSHWPEKETAIAARINHGVINIVAAFGLSSLYQGHITHNPKRDKAIFLNRVQSKHWLTKWPNLKIML
ncbi:hypothetical protein EDC56_3686 [Sinobacterium caligoides]|uniref:Nucleotidyltransferase-like protein n=1 Tax=Sinobacterium caligoides TaxID=933926 RepID=A0A3N2DF11_9GAMM|nr:nucleotidyltransferase family protein [Sinobacterium caligoides]ROR98014.1 hypothetical protein EDC56_3686 [Sinobacterium caligoides]